MAGLKIITQVVILLAALCGGIRAQGAARSIAAVQAATRPVIDGVLDDPVWSGAEWQGDFVQLEPSMGAPARAATSFALASDDEYIYAAFRCVNPGGPSAGSTVTRRDGDIKIDNAVMLYLDTFRSRRDCYYFATNSLGIQVDGRVAEDGNSQDGSWDCNWSVASREDSLGWTAEMAIPVGELRIPRAVGALWGVNVRRNYPDYYETSFWVERDRAWRVSQSGDLTGLAEFKKSFSAALYPYAVSLNTNTEGTKRRTIYSAGNTQVVTGADLRFNIGSSVNGNLTYNPDFATVEADQEVINLTRYETFFPEKRLYFLEGAELFKNRINVFYSRRIGDLDHGLKSNGRIGKTNFSVLSVRERATGGQPSSRTSVLRLQRDILGSSNIGLIAVDRSYAGGSNRVLSTDAAIYFLDDGKFTSQFIGSFPSGDGKATKAYYLRAVRENEIYRYHLRFTSIDPGFKDNVNTVGFIRDDDRRELDSDITYRWWLKRYAVERINFETRNNVFWSHSGALRNVKLRQGIGVTFSNKISVGFSNSYLTELYEKRYRNHTILAQVAYNEEQWNQIKFVYQRGRNFDRDLVNWFIRPRLKLSDKLTLDYKLQVVRFSPDNSADKVLNVLTSDYNFTNDIYLRMFAQHNSRNNRVYLYGLFGWRFKPPFGALYVAYTADRYDSRDGGSMLPPERKEEGTFFVKLTIPLDI